MSKKSILEKRPDISMSTVEFTLSDLLKEGYIIKTGAGRSTAYVKNSDYETLKPQTPTDLGPSDQPL